METSTLTTLSTGTSSLSGSLNVAFSLDRNYRYPFVGLACLITTKGVFPSHLQVRRDDAGGILIFRHKLVWNYNIAAQKRHLYEEVHF